MAPIRMGIDVIRVGRLLGMGFVLLIAWATAQDGVPPGLGNVSVTSALRPEFRAAPGESHRGLLTIRNAGAEAVTVAISQADFTLDSSGQIRYVDAGENGRSNRSWIEVASQATVPPGVSVDLPYSVQVPPDPDLSGTYWSMIVVEPLDPETFRQEGDGGGAVRTNVTVSFRYGVVVIVDVGESEGERLLFTDPQFTGEAGDYILGVDLENPGPFLIEADLWLELYDEQADLVTRVDIGETRLYPEATRTVRFDIGALAPQRYQAVVIADTGSEDVFGVRYTLSVSEQSDSD